MSCSSLWACVEASPIVFSRSVASFLTLPRLAPGETLQALVHNDGEPVAFQQGSAVNVLLPPDALRVLPGGGVSVAEIREETYGDQPDLASIVAPLT